MNSNNSKNKSKKLLFIAIGHGIGNCISYMPTLKQLKQGKKDIELFVLTNRNPAIKSLLKESDSVDNILQYDNSRHSTVYGILYSYRKLRRMNFDIVINSCLHTGIDVILMAFFTGASIRVGYYRNKMDAKLLTHGFRYKLGRNCVCLELNLLYAMDLEPVCWHCELPAKKDFVKDYYLKNNIEEGFVVGIHAGSTKSQKEKRLPFRKYIEIVKWLIEKNNAEVLFFIGPEEKSEFQNKMEKYGYRIMDSRFHTIIQRDILKVISLISSCDLFVSNDSGLMHIADFLQVPVVTIFGPTNENLYGPVSDASKVVKHDLPCRPCYSEGKISCYNKTPLKCINNIELEEIKEAIQDLAL